jgi:hypothetical protein
VLLLVFMAGYFYFSQQQLAHEKNQQEQIKQQDELDKKLQQMLIAQQAVKQAAVQQAQDEAARVAEQRATDEQARIQAGMVQQKQESARVAAGAEETRAKQPVLQAVNNQTLVLTVSSQKLPEVTHKELASRFGNDMANSKYIYPAPCSLRDECLRYAQSRRAKHLILVTIRTSVTEGDMGGMLAELSIDALLFDVTSSRQLSGVQHQKGQVVSFDSQNIAWAQAIDRLFTNNPAINQFTQAAKSCDINKC